MLHCHEGHDVVELYGRAGFRCDCGNSRLPFSCQLETSTPPRDYENAENVYDDTFFDIYCHCKQTP